MSLQASFFEGSPKEAHSEKSGADRAEILEGLMAPEKSINPKFFYDEQGSKLFDRICDLDEYYQTRTESKILSQYQSEISRAVGANVQLVELGSGSSKKTKILIRGLKDIEAYIPIDICLEQLNEASVGMRKIFPTLRVEPVCADYTQAFTIPERLDAKSKRVFFFPGSTIGNLEPQMMVELLKRVRNLSGDTGGLLIGIDLKKDTEILRKAYNDREGVTAEFNLNVLRRINREVEADFNLENFRHDAFYDERKGRIEMHLVSRKPHSVNIDGGSIWFRESETIHTENSYKFTVSEFQSLAERAGFQGEQVWIDDDSLFSVHYFSAI